MTPRHHSAAVDPRRLSLEPHRIGRASAGERRRAHGPIRPMAGDEPASWRLIAACWFVALVALPAFLTWCGSIR
jgi:hypothetical protein